MWLGSHSDCLLLLLISLWPSFTSIIFNLQLYFVNNHTAANNDEYDIHVVNWEFEEIPRIEID